jgi:hypothetical protein
MGKGMEILKQISEGVQRAVEVARDASNSPHMAPLHAFVRQGADESAQVLPAFPDSNVRPASEPGQLFEPTPQMVTAEITGKQIEMDMG